MHVTDSSSPLTSLSRQLRHRIQCGAFALLLAALFHNTFALAESLPPLLPESPAEGETLPAKSLPILSVKSANAFANGQCAQSNVQYPADTHQLVNAANGAANQKHYLQAVCQYREATKRLPQQPSLRSNLSVLYYNHALTLQETAHSADDFHQVRLWLTLSESEQTGGAATTAQQALANTYFDEAMNLRQQAQQPNQLPNWQTIRQLLAEAQHRDPVQPHYQEALANTYVSEGIDLIKAGQLQTGIPLLEKGQAMAPNSESIRMSLANAYLRQAQQSSDTETRRQWIDKALTVSNNDPDIERVAHEMSQGARVRSADADSDDHSNTTSRYDLPLAQQIAQLEVALGLPQPDDETLPQRIKTIEHQVYGKTQKGTLQKRTASAYQQILGRGQTYKNSAPELIQQTIPTAQGTYLDDVFAATNGRVMRWGRFPLKVYWDFPEEGLTNTGLDLTTGQIKQAIEDGMNRWVAATGEFVSIQWVEEEDDADLSIHWVDHYVDRYSDPGHTVLDEYQIPTRSKLQKAVGIASMVTPGMYGLAPRAIMTGMQYHDYRQLKALRDESDIHVGASPLHHVPPQVALIRLGNLAAYEFGHTLGIKGNSSNPADLMHPATLVSDTPKAISEADVATFRALYERPANIVLNID